MNDLGISSRIGTSLALFHFGQLTMTDYGIETDLLTKLVLPENSSDKKTYCASLEAFFLSDYTRHSKKN